MFEQLADTLHHFPDATVLVDAEGQILNANHAAEQLFGYTTGGLNNQPLGLLIPQDRREIHHKLLREFAERPSVHPRGTGLPRHGVRHNGSMFAADIAFKPVEKGGSGAFIATVRDISASKQTELELRQSNRSLKLLGCINRLFIRINNEQLLLQEVCRTIVETGNYRMAWVGAAEQDENRKICPVAFHGFNNGFIEKLDISWGSTGNNQTAMSEAIRTGTPVIRNDIATNSQMAPCRADAKQRGYQSVLALPLKMHHSVWGALALFAPEASAFGRHEYQTLVELSDDLSFAIQSIRSES